METQVAITTLTTIIKMIGITALIGMNTPNMTIAAEANYQHPVTSSIRSQETEVYSGRDRTSRQPHDYENYRDNRSRSRDRDSRDKSDRDYSYNH